MLHRSAKLTPFGRRLLVDRILVEGWAPAIAAETVGVSRATAYKWLRRYRAEGLAGLEDRSARPVRQPRALAERDVRRILRLRRRLRVGPHRLGPLLGHPRSTVYGVLRRHGVSRLAHADRLSGAPVRYVRERPGELLHVDVKEAGSGARRWWTPHARTAGASRPGQWLRPSPRRHRRCHPAGLQRRPPRRAGGDHRALHARRGYLLRRARRARRAGDDRQSTTSPRRARRTHPADRDAAANSALPRTGTAQGTSPHAGRTTASCGSSADSAVWKDCVDTLDSVDDLGVMRRSTATPAIASAWLRVFRFHSSHTYSHTMS